MDLGSGLGYLSRCLAFEYAWPVVAVEGEASNVAGASRIDERIERKAREQALRQEEAQWDSAMEADRVAAIAAMQEKEAARRKLASNARIYLDEQIKEKDALNFLFIAIPLVNVLIPVFWKSFSAVFTADCLLMAYMYYNKGAGIFDDGSAAAEEAKTEPAAEDSA